MAAHAGRKHGHGSVYWLVGAYGGLALASRSASVLALIGVLLGRVYARRINAEEELLRLVTLSSHGKR